MHSCHCSAPKKTRLTFELKLSQKPFSCPQSALAAVSVILHNQRHL